MWKLCVCPQISAFTTDLVLSLIIPTSPLKLKVSTNWDLTFFPTWTYATSCECPKRLTMPWSHTFPRMIVPITGHLVSGAVLTQAILNEKCLIPDSSPDFSKCVKTQHKMNSSVFFLFRSHVASSDLLWPLHAAVEMFLPPRGATPRPSPSAAVLIDWSSETLVTSCRHQLSGGRTYIANACIQFSTISRHRWKWLKILIFFFLWLRWGNLKMKTFFFFFFLKAANQN